MKRKVHLLLTIVFTMALLLGLSLTAFAAEPHGLTVAKSDGSPAVEDVDYSWVGNKLALLTNDLVVSGSSSTEYIDFTVSSIDIFNVTFSNVTLNYSGSEIDGLVKINNSGNDINISVIGECCFSTSVADNAFDLKAEKTTITGGPNSRLTCSSKNNAIYGRNAEMELELSGNLILNIDCSLDNSNAIYVEDGIVKIYDSVSADIVCDSFGINAKEVDISSSGNINISGEYAINVWGVADGIVTLGGSGTINLTGKDSFDAIHCGYLNIIDSVDVNINGGDTIEAYCDITISTSGDVYISSADYDALYLNGSFIVTNSAGKIVFRETSDYGAFWNWYEYSDGMDIGSDIVVLGSTDMNASESSLVDTLEFRYDDAEYVGTYYIGDAYVNTLMFINKNLLSPNPNPSGPDSSPSKSAPDMATVNIDGVTFNTWEEIIANTPNLTVEKLQKVNAMNDDLLHVNIVGKSDKTVPVSAVQAMDKSTIGGLHVFIGESDAVTFFNSVDYANYTGKNFAHNDTFTENSRTIDFKDKGSINATVMFHSLIAPNATAKIYKVVDGAEVLIGTASSNEFGGICFAINDLATYVIRY